MSWDSLNISIFKLSPLQSFNSILIRAAVWDTPGRRVRSPTQGQHCISSEGTTTSRQVSMWKLQRVEKWDISPLGSTTGLTKGYTVELPTHWVYGGTSQGLYCETSHLLAVLLDFPRATVTDFPLKAVLHDFPWDALYDFKQAALYDSTWASQLNFRWLNFGLFSGFSSF